MAINTSHFKEKLLEEKKRLEDDLKSVGQKDPTTGADWEAKQNEVSEDTADRTEVADSLTDYEENTALVKTFETDLQAVSQALDKIENNTYGICEICKEEIEEARLEANPAARTCIAHKDEIL